MSRNYILVLELMLFMTLNGCGLSTQPRSVSILQGLCESNPNDPCCPGSPIVLDLDGNGFDLTGRDGGVQFDLRADGRPNMIAWTAPGSDDAWLVLDRNGNGVIDDGSEMFGNFSEQPTSPAPNGFIALAMFDAPDAGGNDDGRIDVNDSVFARLRLWQDRNHDGISQSSELVGLPEAGVKALNLDYNVVNTSDENGNSFRYAAKVEGDNGAHVGSVMYDVFLSSGSGNAGSATGEKYVWRWNCTASCRQVVKPPWDPAVFCLTQQLNSIGPFAVTQSDACLAAELACVRTLLTDTDHCTLGSPISCSNCQRTLVRVPDDTPPEGCS